MEYFFMWDVNSQRKLNYDESIPLDPSLINVSKSYEHAKTEKQNLLYEIKLSKQSYEGTTTTEFSRSILLSVSEDNGFGIAALEIPQLLLCPAAHL